MPELSPLEKAKRLAATPTPWYKRHPLSMELPITLRDWTKPEMRPNGGGTFHKDEQGWSAKIGRDGRVSFKDKPSFSAKIVMPCPSCIKEGLKNWSKDPQSSTSKPLPLVIIPMIAGKFDVTDWVMRRAKQDPYSYQKAQFLERTRGQRMRMAAGEKSGNLRNSLFHLRRDLRKVWNNSSLSHQRRRRQLFELWDECAEVGSSEVLAAAAGVRVTIISFIRHRLPSGSKHGFSVAELKALNASKKSSALFAPYER